MEENKAAKKQFKDRSQTVNQMSNRVQNLKAHMAQNKNVVGTDLRSFTGVDRQRESVKFTAAGFPVHDYIKEMRE